MPNYTTNYNLKKPLHDEFYEVNDFNGNADIIDTKLKELADAQAEGSYLPLAGGTLTGEYIQFNNGTSRLYGSTGIMAMQAFNAVGQGDNNDRSLEVYSKAHADNVGSAVRLLTRENGVQKAYKLYGEHNRSDLKCSEQKAFDFLTYTTVLGAINANPLREMTFEAVIGSNLCSAADSPNAGAEMFYRVVSDGAKRSTVIATEFNTANFGLYKREIYEGQWFTPWQTVTRDQTATHTKSGTTHALTAKYLPVKGTCECSFLTTAAFTAGDIFTVNGQGYTGAQANGETLDSGLFVSGKLVTVTLDVVNHTINFKGGGGLSNSKLAATTATATDVLSGKTFYSGDTTLKTGTRPKVPQMATNALGSGSISSDTLTSVRMPTGTVSVLIKLTYRGNTTTTVIGKLPDNYPNSIEYTYLPCPSSNIINPSDTSVNLSNGGYAYLFNGYLYYKLIYPETATWKAYGFAE